MATIETNIGTLHYNVMPPPPSPRSSEEIESGFLHARMIIEEGKRLVEEYKKLKGVHPSEAGYEIPDLE